MTTGSADGADLLAIVDRVIAQAVPGEQVEAFVSRGGDTEVRIYEGEVEHFVSAQAEGIGIRVIRDGRTGFAYAGTLEETAVVCDCSLATIKRRLKRAQDHVARHSYGEEP